MKASTSNLVERDLAVLWHPCSQMRDYRTFAPLEVVSAEGCRLHLADGRVVLDAISSWWCKSLGHRHPHIVQAIRDQLDAFEHVILANTTNEPVVRLCERLLKLANQGFDSTAHFGKVFLADNGSTAVEVALKMAIQAQAQRGQSQRTQFIALQNGYHGETAGALSVGDCPLYNAPYAPMLFKVAFLHDLPYRTGPNDPRWLDASQEWPAIEAQLMPMAQTAAAIIYEPVLQGAGGMLLYSPDLLKRLHTWANAHGVYLIADEIAAGMARMGPMLASHLTPGKGGQGGGLPDFACLSKGLTGGTLPLSCVLTTEAIYDLFDADYADRHAFLHSNTYTGNALAVAGANAALDVFASEKITERVAQVGPGLCQRLEDLAAKRAYLHRVRGCGMMAAVDVCQPDGSALDPRARTGYRVYQEAVRRGALLRPLGDTMYLFPPLNCSQADLDQMADILADSLASLLG